MSSSLTIRLFAKTSGSRTVRLRAFRIETRLPPHRLCRMGRPGRRARRPLRPRPLPPGPRLRPVAAALADRGWRVVCPDLAGRGRSDWLDNPYDYNLPQYVLDMTVLMAAIGAPEIDWIGTSLGGLIGMIVAGQKRIAGAAAGDQRYRAVPAVAGAAAARPFRPRRRRAASPPWTTPSPTTSANWRRSATYRTMSGGISPATISSRPLTDLAQTGRPGDHRRLPAGLVLQSQPLDVLGRDHLPNPGAARRRIGPAAADHRRRNDAPRARAPRSSKFPAAATRRRC